MNDVDLEDLESRLYSQVYHGAAEEIEENIFEARPNSPPNPTAKMGKQRGRYFGPWSPSPRYQNRSKNNNPRTPSRKNLNKSNSESTYSKREGYNKPRKPPPLPPPPPVITVSPERSMNSKEKSKARWKAKMKERIRQKRAQKAQSVKENSVITLSDSEEDDSCVLIDNNWPVLSVADSDDESQVRSILKVVEQSQDGVAGDITLKSEPVEAHNESITDDVIYVEPVVAPVVVFSIDEEAENHEKSSEAAPSTPDKASTRQHRNERKELLGTPDSASNDFMSNSEVELSQRDFNFSLHGSDFHGPGEFLKPAPRNETCETESSSSTTDANSVNLMKTVVFNEVDFPRDDIFSENNLESFGNFITPLRNNPVQSSPVRTIDALAKGGALSDVSSESDLEESHVDRSTKLTKQLPELSPMQSKSSDVCVAQVARKGRKNSNMCSKYDLLNSTSNQKDSAKKKKRNKKRKSGSGVEDDGTSKSNLEIEASEISDVTDELKRKKRRSSQLENVGESLENQAKKRLSGDVMTEASDSSPVEPVASKSELETDKSAHAADERICPEEVIAEKSSQETVNVEDVPHSQQSSDSILAGLAVVDETFSEEAAVVISDSESALSPLNESSDIQLNLDSSEQYRTLDACTSPGAASQLKKDLQNCSVKELQMDMSNDPDLWAILESDMYPSMRSKGRRCNRCKQFGHINIRCPNKMEVKCALCGASGHYEPRCPNKLCTQCGQRSPYSTTYCNSCFKFRKSRCRVCSMPGHLPSACPDLWRRYHLTTEEGPIVSYDGPPLKEKNQLWCSGCAQSGHLEHSCRFYKSIYPPTDSFIKSYADVYNLTTENEQRERREERSVTSYVPRHQPPPLLPNPPPVYKRPLLQIPPFLQAQQLPNQMANFGINQLNNQIYQSFQVQRPVRPNFAQNSFRPMNFNVNPFLDGIFVANQQNFFPPVGPNLIQNQPQNSFGPNPTVFGSPLPNFVSLESEPETSFERSFEEVDSIRSHGRYFKTKEAPTKTNKARKSIFFSSTARQLQHFINVELFRLSKLSVSSEKHVKEVKRMQSPKKRGTGREDYYEKVNMLLFGVFNLVKGKTHLERLKQFKMERLKSGVDNRTRQQLHTSYCYIFGGEKNNGVQYHDLLRTI